MMRFRVLTVLISLSMLASEPLSSCACEPSTPQEEFNHKAEVAFQLAQGEVDRVRLFVERNHNVLVDLPVFNGNSLTQLPAPVAINDRFLLSFGSACPGLSERENMEIAANALLKVDIDGDCKADFLLQAARTKEVRKKASSSKTFSMLVRVYSVIVEANISGLKTEPIFLDPPSPSNHRGRYLKPLDILQEQEHLQPLAVLQYEIAF